MRVNLKKASACIALILISFLFAFLLPRILPPVDTAQLYSIRHNATLLHLSTNSFFRWNPDWLFSLFGFNSQLYHALLLSMFSLGLFAWLSKEYISVTRTFISVVGTVFSLLALFGFDTLFFSILAPLPWLIIVSNWFLKAVQIGPLHWFAILIVLERAYSLAKPFSWIPLLFALLLVLLPYLQITAWCDRARSSKLLILWFFLFVFTAVLALSVESVVIPNYPSFARLGLQLQPALLPLFGPVPSIELVSRYWVSEYTYLYIALILLFLYLGGRQRSFKFTENFKKIISCGFLLSIILLFESLPFKGQYTNLSPISAIITIVPHLSYVSVPFLLTGISLFFCILLLSIVKRATLLIILIIAFLNGSPFITSDQNQKLFEGKAYSPSYSVVFNTGTWILTNRLHTKFRSVNLANLSAELTASHNSSELNLLMDKKLKSRWSAKKGKQGGDEWFKINFKEATPISGLVLNIKKYKNDFPRAIKISALTTCEDSNLVEQRVLINYTPWIGPPMLTKEGYPYFGNQSELKLIFPEDIQAKCIKVQNIGKSSSSDWSVAEVTVLQPIWSGAP